MHSFYLASCTQHTYFERFIHAHCLYLCVCVCVCVYARVCSFSHSVVSNSFATPWTIAHQAPLSIGFSRQEYWSGLPFPTPGYLPDPGIKPALCFLHW